jgi:hypothetical protein
VRQKVSKCPAPEDCDEEIPVAATCGELPQDAARIQSGIQNPNPESRIQNPHAHEARGADFEEFWKAYPRKEGKQKARQAFEKVTVPLETLLQAVERQITSAQWTKDGGQFIPHPATWLNGCRWEDELPKNVPKWANDAFHDYTQREYKPGELDAIGDDLMEEARKYKGKTA